MSRLEGCSLEPGFVVSRHGHNWKVVEKLGSGGFGAVYRVEEASLGITAAMKVESLGAKNQVMKMEVAVIRRLKGKKHAVTFYDCGRVNDSGFNYLIMGLLGENLSRLRRKTPYRQFSLSTTLRLGLQGIDALEELHSVGFVHRDVKPGNFAMRADRVLCIIDFGLARQFTDHLGRLRPPRSNVAFRGTLMYASVNCHRGGELGRGDDLVSLVYCLAEFRKPKLPWRLLHSKPEVLEWKSKVTDAELFGQNSPAQFPALMRAVEALDYTTVPDYKAYKRLLSEVKEIAEDEPFDWEPGGPFYASSVIKTLLVPKNEEEKRSEDSSQEEDSRSKPLISPFSMS